MKETLDPSQHSKCMKCRSAPARYFGTWAEEGLCRPCILAMPAQIRVKVIRDMGPTDRKRWQLDNLLSLGGEPQPAGELPAGEPTEEELSGMLAAVESGSETELAAFAARAGSKVQDGGLKPSRPKSRRHPRVRVALPLALSVLETGGPAPELQGRMFRAATRVLSATGAQVVSREAALLDLPAGASLHLQILLPSPFGVIDVRGVIRNVARGAGKEVASLGLAFEEVSAPQQRTLERFLASLRT